MNHNQHKTLIKENNCYYRHKIENLIICLKLELIRIKYINKKIKINYFFNIKLIMQLIINIIKITSIIRICRVKKE